MRVSDGSSGVRPTWGCRINPDSADLPPYGDPPPGQAKPPALPASYNPDAVYLSADRRKEMAMIPAVTGKPLNFNTPEQESNYLTSLAMAAPASSYDPKGFLASLGLWGLAGSGRGDRSFGLAVQSTDYKPHTGPERFPIPIPGFLMRGMVNGSPSFTAVQGVLDPVLGAYTTARGLWKEPLKPAQTVKPTGQSPQQRYPDAYGAGPVLEWSQDFHDGSLKQEDGYGTYQIARALGFKEDQARRFATTDYGVDLNKTPYGKTSPLVIGQMDRHFNFQRNGEDTRILWARQHLALAIEYGRKGSYYEAEIELGVGLHSLQDLFAHGQITPTAHVALGKFVDDPHWSPVSMVEATVATRNYLRAYLQGITSADGAYHLDPEPKREP